MVTDKDLMAPSYEARREKVAEAFDELPRGARMAAAHDLGISPSIITNVLKGHVTRQDLLSEMETWLEATSRADVASRQDRSSGKVATVLAFVNFAFVTNVDATMPVDAAYDAYVEWARENGVDPLARSPFVSTLRTRYPLIKLGDERVFAGVELSKGPRS